MARRRKTKQKRGPRNTGGAKPAEQLLLEVLPTEGQGAALCTSLGRAQLARQLVERGWSPVGCWFLDVAHMQSALEAQPVPDGLSFMSQPDFPAETFGTVALPLTQQGDGELTRDLIQQALLALEPGGTLWLATDNPSDKWLRDLLKKLPLKVSPTKAETGVVYRVHMEGPLKRIRNYSADFAFRFRERLFDVSSRPGVFAHRRVDVGARALLDTLPDTVGPRVLEIGCGLGTVALGVASLDPSLEVVALDSNARAVACTRANAAKNELTNVTVEHASAESYVPTADFDLVLANPPYYSKGKIAGVFVDLAARTLKPGGLLHLVTKRPRDYEDIYQRGFDEVEVEEVRGYQVLFARRGAGPLEPRPGPATTPDPAPETPAPEWPAGDAE